MKDHPHRPVIAITGSAGKSTTKEMIAAILRRQWKILKTFDNYNGPFYTIRHQQTFQDPSYRAAVLEYGLTDPEAIARHCQHIQPDIVAITNIGSAHIGQFGGDIKQLAKGKSQIIHGMDPKGLLILNADDPGSKLLDTQDFKGEIRTVGVNQPAYYQAFDIRYATDGMTFRVKYRGATQTYYIPIFGRHHIYNALLALAVADRLGFVYYDKWQGLKTYTRPLGRLTVSELKENRRLIDDSYSANPHAVKAALTVLNDVGTGRKIAVLGDMLELGPYSEKGHAEVGEHLAAQSVDYLVTYGSIAQQIATAAIAKGFPAKHALHFEDEQIDAMHQQIETLMTEGCTVLLKASNGKQLWRTAEHIKEVFSKKENT